MMIEIQLLTHNKLMSNIEICNEEAVEMAIDISGAKRKAKELYETVHNVNQAMISGNVATDLDQIIKNLNLKVFEIDMDELRKKNENIGIDETTSGFLTKVDDQYMIYLNKNHSMNRKRFTIAHEIGHLKLNHLEDIVYRDSTTSLGTNENEVKANAFAAELLMPEELVRYAYNLLKSVSKTARVFGVSEVAAYNR